MQKDILLRLNYDFDPEFGYTQVTLKTSEITELENEIIMDLYVEDIKDLLKGTGMSLND